MREYMKQLWIFISMFFLAYGCFFIHVKCLDEVIVSFSVDDNYAMFLPVTIESIKAHANPNRMYKIFILGDNISEKHQQAIYLSQTKNVKISIIDIQKLVSNSNVHKLRTMKHIKTATYYRFFIPNVLKEYKKAVYLEADQLLQDDVAKLFDVDLADKSLGVIPQPLYKMNKSRQWRRYCQKHLKMKYPEKYFNAGVLVMNLEKLRNNNFPTLAFKIAKNYYFDCLDQDILNFMFSKDSVYISPEWNVEVFILQKLKYTEKPKLIHFSMDDYKPWKDTRLPTFLYKYRLLFWEYAQKTANYEEIKKVWNSHLNTKY